MPACEPTGFITQLLAPFIMEKGRTHTAIVGKSTSPTQLPDTLWVAAAVETRAKQAFSETFWFRRVGQTVSGTLRGRLQPSGPRRRYG
jgi:hypothetical protein